MPDAVVVIIRTHQPNVTRDREVTAMLSNSRVFIRRHLIWLAWYPLRGRKCMWSFERSTRPHDPARDGWHLAVALGPAYLGLGPGVPTP